MFNLAGRNSKFHILLITPQGTGETAAGRRLQGPATPANSNRGCEQIRPIPAPTSQKANGENAKISPLLSAFIELALKASVPSVATAPARTMNRSIEAGARYNVQLHAPVWEDKCRGGAAPLVNGLYSP
jgi:hypothetical protein